MKLVTLFYSVWPFLLYGARDVIEKFSTAIGAFSPSSPYPRLSDTMVVSLLFQGPPPSDTLPPFSRTIPNKKTGHDLLAISYLMETSVQEESHLRTFEVTFS